MTGLSLGIALQRRGVPVVVHEAGCYPRHRVCGEFICGVQQETLNNLGISSVFKMARISKNCAWFDDEGLVHRDELPITAYGVSRYEMDLKLSELFVEAGGRLQCSSRQKPQSLEGLVWTAGRKAQKSEWIGLKCHLYHFKGEADLEMHMGNGGYVGIAPIESGKWNVCGLFKIRSDLKGTKKGLLMAYLSACGLDSLVDRLKGFEVDPTSYSAVAGFTLGKQKQNTDLLCLGDASTMIPPFTGNGMSMAFESAEIALNPLLDYANRKSSWKDASLVVRRNLDEHFHRRMKVAMTMHPFLLSSIGQKTTKLAAKVGVLPFQTLFKHLR